LFLEEGEPLFECRRVLLRGDGDIVRSDDVLLGEELGGGGDLDKALVVIDDRVAVGGLVAGGDEGIECEWVLVRRRQLLLDE